jgi:2-dehydro-3-deoxyphosphooctonate aldolase (KDO 8-P synthase)
VDALFLEVHDSPEQALSDGANALHLADLPGLWRRLLDLDAVTRLHMAGE